MWKILKRQLEFSIPCPSKKLIAMCLRIIISYSNSSRHENPSKRWTYLFILQTSGNFISTENFIYWNFEFINIMRQDDIQPDHVTYNSLISGLCKYRKIDQALDLLQNMKNSDVHPTAATYTMIISSLGRLGNWRKAEEVIQIHVLIWLFKNMLPPEISGPSCKLENHPFCFENVNVVQFGRKFWNIAGKVIKVLLFLNNHCTVIRFSSFVTYINIRQQKNGDRYVVFLVLSNQIYILQHNCSPTINFRVQILLNLYPVWNSFLIHAKEDFAQAGSPKVIMHGVVLYFR